MTTLEKQRIAELETALADERRRRELADELAHRDAAALDEERKRRQLAAELARRDQASLQRDLARVTRVLEELRGELARGEEEVARRVEEVREEGVRRMEAREREWDESMCVLERVAREELRAREVRIGERERVLVKKEWREGELQREIEALRRGRACASASASVSAEVGNDGEGAVAAGGVDEQIVAGCDGSAGGGESGAADRMVTEVRTCARPQKAFN